MAFSFSFSNGCPTVLLVCPTSSINRSQVQADVIGAQDRIGLTIESTTAIPFVGLLNAAAIFPMDRNLYFHEAKSSARYSAATFLISYTLIEVPSELLGAFGYAAIVSSVACLVRDNAEVQDECWRRYANFRSNLFRIFDDYLGLVQHGRVACCNLWSLDPERGLDCHVRLDSSRTDMGDQR